ncbi:NAD(P)H-dependent oxidoreductase subunit E [Sedimenticola selenatireducens]
MKVKTTGRKPRRRGRQAAPADLTAVKQYLDVGNTSRDRLIEYLHRIQDDRGYLDSGILTALAEILRLSTGEVYEVASFYHHFNIIKDNAPPPPALTIRVCDSISCNLAGAETLITELQAGLGEAVRLQRVPCIGRCENAPVAVVGTNPIPFATPDRVCKTVDQGIHDEPIPKAALTY